MRTNYWAETQVLVRRLVVIVQGFGQS